MGCLEGLNWAVRDASLGSLIVLREGGTVFTPCCIKFVI